MRKRAKVALFTVLLALASPAAGDQRLPRGDSYGSTTPAFGGQGGGRDASTCPRDTYMVGISGKSGEWIDALAPICAPWDADRHAFGPIVHAKQLGGSGGSVAIVMCPVSMAITGWEIARIDNGGETVVRGVSPQCERITAIEGDFARPGRLGPDGSHDPKDNASYLCSPGWLANGINGASGKYIDSAGLSCEKIPPELRGPTGLALGRVNTGQSSPRPPRDPCVAARDSHARNSPVAYKLDELCARLRAARLIGTSVSASPIPQITPSEPGKVYNSPMIVAANGQITMLDYCRDYGSSCGKPAADAFCMMKGHPAASGFQISDDIGHTAIISTGNFCDDPTCDGFTKIQCEP